MTVRTLVKGIVALIAAVPLLGALTLLALQSSAIATWSVRTLAPRFLPDGVALRVGRVDGSWLRTLSLENVALLRPDGDTAIAFDRLQLRYRLRPLFRHTFAIDTLRVEAPDMRLRRSPDSTWTLLAATPDTTSAATGTPSPWTVRVARLRVDGARFAASVTPDSVYRIHDLVIDAQDIATGATPHGLVRRVAADVQWGMPDSAQGRLLAEGVRWDSSRISLDTLLLRTAASRIHGSGIIALTSTRSDETRFRLEASPLALPDLRPFLALAGTGTGTATAGIAVRGTGTGYHVDARIVADAGGELHLTGRYEPGDGGPFALTADARLAALDPARFVAKPGLTGPVNGDVAIDLKGTGVHDLSGTARIGIENSRLGTTRIREVSLDTRFDEGAGDATLRTDAAGLTVDGTGRIDLRGDTVRYGLDGAAHWAADSAGAAGGRLAVRGTGMPATGRLDLRLDLDTAAIGTAHIDGGTLALHARQGVVDGSFALAIGDARVEGGLEARPFADSGDWRVRDGRIAGLDLAALAATAPSSSLNASFTANGALSPGAPSARLDVRIDSSTVGRDTISEGTLRLRLADRHAGVDGTVRVGDGRIRIAAEAWPGTQPLRYAVHELRFENVDVGALAGRTGVSTRLTGALQASGAGTDPATLRSEATLTLDSSRIDRAQVEGATLSLTAADGRFRGRAAIALGGGSVRANGDVVWSDRPSWSADGTVDLRSLGTLLGDTTTGALAARFDAGGTGFAPRDAEGHARLSLDTASWRTVRADSGRLDLRIRNGAVLVDTLWARTNVARIEGGGHVPFLDGAAGPADTADLRLAANLESLRPLDDALPSTRLSAGEGTAELHVTGTADSLRLRGTAHLGALLVGTTRLVGLDANADARYSGSAGLGAGTLDVVLDRLAFPTATITRTRLEATRDTAGTRLHARALVDSRRTAELDARFATADARPVVIIEHATFQVDNDEWTLPRPARVRYGGGIDIEDFVLRAADQRIALDASWGAAGLVSLHANIDSLRVETLADLAGFDRVRGVLSTRVDLDGAGSARTGDAAIDFAMRSADGGGGDIHATARIAGDSATIDGSVAQDGRRDLRVQGSVPLRSGAGAMLDLRARADSFRVNLLTPVLDPDVVRGLAGLLDGEIRLSGTTADPKLDGSLALLNGRAHLTALGVTWRLDGRADLSGNAAHVRELRVRSGDGDLRLTGDVSLDRATVGHYDLQARMDGFRAIDNDLVRAVLSGDVNVAGTLSRPDLSGKVAIDRGDLYLGSGLAAGNVEDVTLTDADYAELEDYFGYPIQRRAQSAGPGFDALALDLSIEVGRDSWLRQGANPELAVQLTGEMSVKKEPGPDLQLLGELDAIPEHSYVEQFGRRFDLSQGRLTFRGDPLATQLDLQARYTVPSRNDNQPEATITLGLAGQVGDLRVTLGSEPSMSNADIVSYIATGRPASQSLSTGQGQGEGVGARAGGLALDQAASLIESFAAERVGLDVVEIRRQGLQSATLIAGRYVSPTLYLGFQQPLGISHGGTESASNDQTRVEIELQAWRWLLLNFQSGGQALQFFLKARHGY